MRKIKNITDWLFVQYCKFAEEPFYNILAIIILSNFESIFITILVWIILVLIVVYVNLLYK